MGNLSAPLLCLTVTGLYRPNFFLPSALPEQRTSTRGARWPPSRIRKPFLAGRNTLRDWDGGGGGGGGGGNQAQRRSEFTEEGVWKDGEHGVLWEAHEIARAVGGTVVSAGPAGSVCTDSRSLEPGQWFLALAGPNFDGHDFLQQALERGCAGAIGRAAARPAAWPRGFIAVDGRRTGVAALHGLAAAVRRRFRGAVVGITGSAGKTTVRAMAALALESLPGGGVHSTEGNLNNHVGVPLTLLRLPAAAAACVLEMGMSRAGELQALALAARPTVRVLLNVGPAHAANFASLEAVAAAKRELLSSAEPGDVCVLNADDPLVMRSAVPRGVRVVLFGRRRGCHVRIAEARPTRGGSAVQITLEQWHDRAQKSRSGSHTLSEPPDETSRALTEELSGARLVRSSEPDLGSPHFCPTSDLISRVDFEVCSPGLHLAVNAAAAAAVAVSLGVPLGAACKSMSKYAPVGMRAALEDVGGSIWLVNDAYNANPMSMEAGMRILGSMEVPGRKVALLGDMLELGSVGRKAHADALLLCRQVKVAMIGLVGASFAEAAACSGLGKEISMVCQHSQELAAKVAGQLRPGDAVLVKGSRSMKMEAIVDAIRAKAREGFYQKSPASISRPHRSG